jgi:NitT/TauT family transport system substrate-binding protein
MIEKGRRRFLGQLAMVGVAGVGGLGGVRFGGGLSSFAAEPPPEITKIRLEKYPPATCVAPQYVAGELLRAEGFTHVLYENGGVNPVVEVVQNKTDWDTDFSTSIILEIDKGAPLTIVAGLHLGCGEIVAQAKFVGLDPDKDIHWVDTPDPLNLFIERKIDAFLAIPPDTLELRARGIGHSLQNATTDRPWSHYFCCMLFSRTEFIQRYPAATKRIVRAFMRATDLCVSQPARVARMMVDRGFTDRYAYALQTLQELPYGAWRDHDPEDTVRFFALRLNEAGFIKSDPQRIISQHTNWRFLNEVKRELKV